jgi:hypothetical protein
VETRSEPFDERSEPDADGAYDWVYRGMHFHFATGAEELIFRCYDEEMGVAALVSPSGWRPEVYRGALFRQAVAFLHAQESVHTVHVADPESGAFSPLADASAAARRLGLPGVDGVDRGVSKRDDG